MLEEKIEEIKENGSKTVADIRDIRIDLAVETLLPNELFETEADKLNFYREAELIQNMQELRDIQEDLSSLKSEVFSHSFFDLLQCKIYAKEYGISSIKKAGVNFQIDFKEGIDLETLKAFLRLDTEVRLSVVDIKRLRSPVKLFGNDKNFLQYLLDMFEKKL